MATALSCINVSAQNTTTQGEFTYKRGATYVESTLPSTPQASSIVKYSDVPFSYSIGAAQVNVPIYTLQGKELKVPIGLQYTSNGIKLDEIAGVAGLGWRLSAGGCITRTVMDMPDEFTSFSMTHSMPSGTLLADLISDTNNTSTYSYLRRICTHKVDSRLDRYNYSVCGLNGSFVIADGEVVQLSGDGVLIDYTRAGSKNDLTSEILSFTIVGPDGHIYTLSEREIGEHDGTKPASSPSPVTGEQDKWSATTGWYLTSIKSAGGLDVVTFNYKDGLQWDKTITSQSQTLTTNSLSGLSTISSDSNTIANKYSTKLLTSITLNGYRVDFGYYESKSQTRHLMSNDWNYPARLSSIVVQAPGGVKIKQVDIRTNQEPNDGRIILSELDFKDGAGKLNDIWKFTYDTRNREVSHLEQDWFGYYNGVENQSGNGLCPFSHRTNNRDTYGEPNSKEASYMSLSEMEHDGVKTTFEYGFFKYAGSTETTIGSPVVKITTSSTPIKGDNSTIKTMVRSFSYSKAQSDGPVAPSFSMYCTVRAPFTSSDTNPGQQSVTWSSTLHETPVGNGLSARDTRMFYGKVIEIVKGGDICQKSIKYYDTKDVLRSECSVFDRFPESAAKQYKKYPPYNMTLDPYSGIKKSYTESGPSRSPLLIREEEYAFDPANNDYKIISAVNYSYTDSQAERDILVSYEASQVWYPAGIGNCPYEYIYHYPVYARSYSGRLVSSRSDVEYFDADLNAKDSICVNTTYYERDSLLQLPARIKSRSVLSGLPINGNGKTLRQFEYTYPQKGSALYTRHRIATPIKTTYTITPDYLGLFTGGTKIDGILRKSLKPIYHGSKMEIKREELEYGYFSVGGHSMYLPKSHSEYTDGRIHWKETVTARDSKGNIAEFTETGCPTKVIIWSYNGQHPVAVIENCTLARVEEKLQGLLSIDAITNSQEFTQRQQEILNDTLRRLLPEAHITVYTYKPGIGVSSITDLRGVKTTFEYDASGRLVSIKDTDGKTVEEYEYHFLNETNKNGLRWLKKKVYRDEGSTTYSEDVTYWNSLGLKEQEIAIGGSGDGSDLLTLYEPDALLNDDAREWMAYSAGNTDGQFRDGAKAEAAEINTDKGYYARHYENSRRRKLLSKALPLFDGQHETQYEESAAVNFPCLIWTGGKVKNCGNYPSSEIKKSSVIDADGRVKHTYTDILGKTLAISTGDDAPTYYIYDTKDRLKAVCSSGIELTDTLNMWRYDYDSLSRISAKGIPGCIKESFTYDEGDRIASQRQDNTLIEKEYDSFGRLVKVFMSDPGNRTSHTLVEEHHYDSYPSQLALDGGTAILGRIASWNDSFIRGNESLTVLAEFEGGNGAIGGYAFIAYRYDRKGQLVEQVTLYPDGGMLSEQFEYDFSGNQVRRTADFEQDDVRLCRFTREESFDGRNRLVRSISDLEVVYSGNGSLLSSAYEYDSMGRLYKVSTGAGISPSKVVQEMSYTPQGWLSCNDYVRGTSAIYGERLTYANSYAGFVTQREDAPGETTHYTYDYAGRLIREKVGKASYTDYLYDTRSNLLSISQGGTVTEEYAYSGDRLSSLDLGAGAHSFEYDSRGRIINDYTPNGAHGIKYNNYLNKVSGTEFINYSYLANGFKTSSLIHGIEDTRGLIYRGPFIFRQKPDRTWSMESVEVTEGKLTDGVALIYLKDHLGSVTKVVNANTGEVVESSDYTSYGKRASSTSTEYGDKFTGVTLRAHFTGKEDQKADFYVDYTDFGARHYSPVLRRWLTPDPLSEKYYGISPYAYCAGNPVNFIDVNGRDSIYVIDSPTRPRDKGVMGETYTGLLYVEINGVISGPYRGSSYPNSVSTTDNSPKWKTLNEGAFPFNNKYGHSEGSQYGLNIVNEKGERLAPGTTPDGKATMITETNVHIGFSDKGTPNSRGSKGCITLHPDDAAAFFSNFKWYKNKHTGSSSGTIFVYRTNEEKKEEILNHINNTNRYVIFIYFFIRTPRNTGQ